MFEDTLKEIKAERIVIHVENQEEKQEVVRILESYLPIARPYTKRFDEQYPNIGWDSDQVCGYSRSCHIDEMMSYEQFMGLYCSDEDSSDSILIDDFI